MTKPQLYELLERVCAQLTIERSDMPSQMDAGDRIDVENLIRQAMSTVAVAARIVAGEEA